MRQWRWFDDLGQDLRHTVRALASNPGFTAMAIVTLVLGIGANTAIFSATNAILLRGLPVQKPEQIFRVTCDQQPALASNTGDSSTSFSDYVFEHMRTPNGVMSDLMAYVPLGFNKISVRTAALPEEVAADLVSGNFFSGLGVRSQCGRLLSTRDEEAHAAAAVVSYGYAARRFGNA